MRIQVNRKMENFFSAARRNMMDSSINDFLDLEVQKEDEESMIRRLAENGASEFAVTPHPSLFLSVDAWNNSPYHKAIHLEDIQDEHFSYEKMLFYGNRLFNADVVQKDENRMMKDWMKLRAMDRDFEAIALFQDDEDWMMDVPSEAITNDPYAEKAHGHVLTMGLGIGYFLFMALRNPAVTSITCIERSKEVIAMFQKYILPQFPRDKEIHIIQGDAFDYWHEDYLSQFDYVYVDIWQSSDDGLAIITRLLEQYEPPFENTDFWIEDSCHSLMWSLSFLYFDSLAHHTKMHIEKDAHRYMRKIIKYYEAVDETITDEKRLQFLIYDTKTIRHILATKV